MISIQDIFDKVLGSEEGACVVLTFKSYEEMETARVQLYKEMRKLREAHKELAKTMTISRKVEKDRWIVYLSKVAQFRPENVVYITPSGEVEPFEKGGKSGTGKPTAVEKSKRNRTETGKGSRNHS